MLNAIATVSLSGTLEEKLLAAAQAGFRAIELFDADFLGSALGAVELRALLDELGLVCALYQPFRDLEGMPEPHRRIGFERIEKKFEIMRTLGCDRLLLCSNCSLHASGEQDLIVDDLRALGDVAARYGFIVGYEALAWARHVFDHRTAWEIVKRVDHPNVGIILDSFHSLSRDIPSESVLDIDPVKIVFVQLADAPRLAMDLLYWSRHFRCLPGQGDFDVTGYVAAIFKTGYRGPLSLEIFNDRFRSSSPLLASQDGLRSLRALRDAVARASDMETTMPPPVTIERVEFVEFAVDESDREGLEALLSAAGFTQVGSHREKAVDLWRNGAASFVLNFVQDGFASAHRIMHGTSICAVGLVVADEDAAIERAHALGITQHPSDIPRMPAIRGVAGSLVYVLEAADAAAIWEKEFDPMPSSEDIGSNVGVIGIDHVAAVVPSEEFLSWRLYWCTLFDVNVQPPEEIIDPNGLVQSQAISNVTGSFRITLNSTDARDALSARFLSQSFGAGFQHIALGVDDLAQAARQLNERGLPTLPISANYQDDAEIRLQLTSVESGIARRYDIMLDADGQGGLYRQLYSRAFAKTFFFEFVERRGYQGYGATNASIRLAAQSRFRPPPTLD